MAYLDELNPQQRQAVEYIDGPELVIAGAGSGKTRVLTYKIVHLLANGYEPWRLMALTFTNKAAREMRERIEKQVGQKAAAQITMGTFHSVFARLLRRNAERIGYSSNYTIYDAAASKNLVKTVIRDMGLDEKVYKPSTVANVISNSKTAMLLPDAYLADPELLIYDRDRKMPMLGEIYKAYCRRCRVAQAMDFDDLLVNTSLLLRDNPEIQRHYQEFYRYILVDEYQDTNFAQHSIVRLLCDESEHLWVVGDDAQSIYAFRGANIQNILSLKRQFPRLETFKLEQNYRSTQNIINAAGSLIEKNIDQIPKNVFSANGEGHRIEVVRCYSDFEESSLVAHRISQLKVATGDSFNEFAILYRTNAQSRLLEESLRKRNIPYRIYGGQSFYQRKEIKDATAFFRLSINPADDEALRRVINVPARGIGDTTVRKLTAAAMAAGVSLWEVLRAPEAYGASFNKGTLRKLHDFTTMILHFVEMVNGNAPADAVAREVLERTGLVAQFMSDNTPENITRYENLQELLNSAVSFVADSIEEGNEDSVTMPFFMAQVSLSTDVDDEQETDDGQAAERVTLMTIHAAKGLEFANVLIVGVEEDLLPSSMSQDSLAQVEEERRLLYVAITRAKRFCMLSYAGSRYRNGMTAMASPSRFLRDIDTRYLNFVTGAEIPVESPHTSNRFPSPRTSSSGGFGSPVRRPAMSQAQVSAAPKWTPRNPVAARHGAVAQSPVPAGAVLHSADSLAVGMTIDHPRFGRGAITSIDAANPSGARIVVNFNNVDFKTLLLKFARFTIVD